MKVFLIGFMGSGKTTIGKKLASYLKYEFVDIDKLIELRAGMSIANFFDLKGEHEFRELEKEILRTSAISENAVIATGGGAPCYVDNIDWMNSQGTTVYLSMSPKALAGRLAHSKAERPLIRNLDGTELVTFIEDKLKGREEFYKKAKFEVSASDLTAERLAFYLNMN